MKKDSNKRVRWSHEPWTVVRTGPSPELWHAYNTRTGERGKHRTSYDEAFKDIPKTPYAEPWGV